MRMWWSGELDGRIVSTMWSVKVSLDHESSAVSGGARLEVGVVGSADLRREGEGATVGDVEAAQTIEAELRDGGRLMSREGGVGATFELEATGQRGAQQWLG